MKSKYAIIGVLTVIVVVITVSLLISKNSQKTTSSNSTTYTLSDIAKHNSENDCYVAINGNVYNVTSFISAHPSRDMIRGCGVDATSLFDSVRKHSGGQATNILQSLIIGKLV